MSDDLPVMHAASAEGLVNGGALCGLRPAPGENLWVGEWFLVTCNDCLSLGAHSMGETQ